MTPFQAIILGVVEGVTEFLPISSTGHLVIVSALLGLDEPPEVKRAVDAFNVVVQGGAIIAVLGLYRGRVLAMLRGLAGRDAVGLRMLRNLLVAFLPAAILGPLLNDAIELHLFRPRPVIAALALGGLALILLTPWQRSHFDVDSGRAHVDLDALGARAALLIGLLQCVAMWPGTSRSMMTIIGGLLVGLRPKQAAEFSFLLGLPTLGGACAYKLLGAVVGDEPGLFEVLPASALVAGLVAATISAAVAVRWLVGYLERHGVAAFGWYRIALSAALAALAVTGVVDFSAD